MLTEYIDLYIKQQGFQDLRVYMLDAAQDLGMRMLARQDVWQAKGKHEGVSFVIGVGF